MKDPIISIKDLLATCVKKAKLIIVLAVVLAIAVCGLKFSSDLSARKAAEAAGGVATEVVVELTDAELEQVEQYVDAVLLRDEVEDYVENSVYMNANPYDLYYVELMYNVQAESDEVEREAILAIRNYVYAGLEVALEAEDDSLAAKYYKEVLQCTSMDYNSYLANGVITISMNAINEEQAKTFATILDKAIMDYVSELNADGMEFAAVKINEVVARELYEALIGFQNDKNNLLNSCNGSVQWYESTLTKQQLKEAYKLLAVDVEVPEEVAQEVPKASINILFLVVGAVLGVVAGVALIAVKYIFTNTIKTEDDVQEMLKLSNLGLLVCKELDKFETLANIGATIAENFNISKPEIGESILNELK